MSASSEGRYHGFVNPTPGTPGQPETPGAATAPAGETAPALAACDRLAAVLAESAARARAAARAAGTGTPGGSEDDAAIPPAAFLAALLNMKVRPALALPGWPEGDPVHLAVFGGTNGGKSTVVNLLLGRSAAGMNPLARYSQHPEAYRPSALGDGWVSGDGAASRFRGYSRHLGEHPPRQGDSELAAGRYRPAFAVHDPALEKAPAFLPPMTTAAVVWDSPDFSTQEAQAYLSAVLDVVALADVVVAVMTPESYADARGLSLLELVADALAPAGSLHVVFNKAPADPSQRAALEADLRGKLSARLGQARMPMVHSLPSAAAGGGTTDDTLGRLAKSDEAAILRGSLAHECSRGPALKRAALTAAVECIGRRLDDALRPLRDQARDAAEWSAAVEAVTRRTLMEGYAREYLGGSSYGEFNRTLVRLMDLMQVPGIGPVIKLAGDVVRMPFKWATGLLRRLRTGSSEAAPSRAPEEEVLTRLIENRWLPELKSAAQTAALRPDARGRPEWAELARRLDSREFLDRLFDGFAVEYTDYKAKVAAEIDTQARAIYEVLERDPVLLNTLRAANLAVNAGTTLLVIKSAGLNWTDAVLGPVVSGLMHVLLEAGLESYIESRKLALKRFQADLIAGIIGRTLSAPVRDLLPGSSAGAVLDRARADLNAISAAVTGTPRPATPSPEDIVYIT
jgi:hypothetical protein